MSLQQKLRSWAESAKTVCGVLSLVGAFWTQGASADVLNLSYDDSDRLVQVQGAITTTEYRYDAAGNLTASLAPVSGALTLTAFSPSTTAVGAQVTLIGSGFSSTATNNYVKFNGIAATVTAASSTTLTVTVPSGATSGTLSVTVAGNTATSVDSFTVSASVPAPLPSITATSATLAAPGDSITLTGTNLIGNEQNLWVRVNGQPATITSSSSTQLVFTVPNGTSGAVVVGTQYGETQGSSLSVTPQGALTADIGLTRSLQIDSGPQPINVPVGKKGIFNFNPQGAENLSLSITAVSTTPSGGSVTVSVLNPDGSVLVNCLVASASGGNCYLPELQTTENYTVEVTPSANNAVNATLTLSSDITGTLASNAGWTTFAANQIGKNGRYTFSGVAGGSYSIDWSTSTLPAWATIYVYRPDGVLLNAADFDNGTYGSGLLDLRGVPITGTYTVRISPSAGTTGQVKIALNLSGTLAIDGTPSSASIASGQNGYYTFSGRAGQRLALGITGISSVPSGGVVTVSVLNADGSLLTSCFSSSFAAGHCNLPPLPTTSTYSVAVTPPSGASTNLTLTLSNTVQASLALDGTVTQFNTKRVGQNARYTFSGIAGQNIDLVVSGSTFSYWGLVTVYSPDGTTLNTVTYASSAAYLTMANLPQSGVYVVVVDTYPYGTDTGSVSLKLVADATNTLGVGGPADNATLGTNQNGDFSFSGTTGQKLGLSISGVNTSPASGSLTVNVLSPDGVTVLKSCGTFTASGGSCNLPTLPSTGTYTIRIVSTGGYSANFSLLISNDVQSQITVDASTPAQFSSTIAGQNARYTFDAIAGQNINLMWSGSTFPNSGTITIYRPDSSVQASTTFTKSATGTLPMVNLPQTGTYTAFVDPNGTDIGAISLQIAHAGTTPPAAEIVNGSLTVDGASTSITVVGTVNYTFSGTVGQWLRLGASNIATYNNIYVSVIGPDNVSVVKDCGYFFYSDNCTLPALPSTGTYSVRMSVAGGATSSLVLTLSAALQGSLMPNSTTATQFSTSRVGQGGRFTFDAIAGQNLTLVSTGSTYPHSGTLVISKPDGTQLSSTTFSSNTTGTFALKNLPATGTYAIFVYPYANDTGAVSLQLLSDVKKPLTLDGAPLSTTLGAGQAGNYTFAGSIGQTLGLGIGGLSTSPVGGAVTISVVDPDGVTTLVSCGSYTSPGGVCTLPPLPFSGEYTVRVSNGLPSAQMNLTVSSDEAVHFIANGTYEPFSLTRIGQNARYTFSAVGGGNYVLSWIGATFPARISVYAPDGTQVITNQFSLASNSSGSFALKNVPSSGIYTILIQPTSVIQGQVLLQVVGDDIVALSSSGDGDVPIPSWALLAMSAMMIGSIKHMSRFKQF